MNETCPECGADPDDITGCEHCIDEDELSWADAEGWLSWRESLEV